MKRLRQFIKRVLTIFKRKGEPGFVMQIIAHWATILGFITSTFFACYAIYLTIKLEKTDKKVELLETLANKTDTTNQNILALINEIQFEKKQNDFLLPNL